MSKSTNQCDICPEAKEATYGLRHYELSVCQDCWEEAESGWDNRHQPKLFAALEKNSLLIPDRNECGLLPREYQPPMDFNL